MPKGNDNPPTGAKLKGKVAQYEPGMRKCLGPCGKFFGSQGPGNRLCAKCRRAAEGASMREERQFGTDGK